MFNNYKKISLFLLFFLVLCPFTSYAMPLMDAKSLYRHLSLKSQVRFDKFERAYHHFIVSGSKKPIFTLIDYAKPSTKKRFWVIDVKRKRILFESHVTHGKNSGELYAVAFSNKVNSFKTSVGIFKSAEAYYGKHGYSLRLDGLSKGLNDNARKRAIVIHGADYADPRVIQEHGQLGRSWGCPALPLSISRRVINLIKEGTFIYAFS
ncbi:hypothetical protein CS022_04750 [Veronia nyctiphanis]|uniref:Uncharacterized protein n=1 Tax=Veronia nyctiphanis TaxID=1278244 RepID=A0A4Q0YSX3_9GAMM|nr:murein L,D-transpeptidase catalytic domain family protein [Veronia nyctiphanis]RXJ74357.1 hypothetical protein CS022_04750 [Veronia nyctiphanis]